MDLPRLAAWLAETPGSIALHESLYMYTIVESVHVIAIMLFVGTIAMVDLRLLGRAFTTTPVSDMTRRILPWTIAGFVVMVITGALLFYAIPVRTFHSVWFRLKVVLLLVAAAGTPIGESRPKERHGSERVGAGALQQPLETKGGIGVTAAVQQQQCQTFRRLDAR